MNTFSIVMPEIKQEQLSTGYANDQLRRYPTNGDDSFYSSSDSAASTSSPTSSITSQVSGSGESDEGVFVEKQKMSNPGKLKAIKNLQRFSEQSTAINFSYQKGVSLDAPLDLSCHSRIKNAAKQPALNTIESKLNDSAAKPSEVVFGKSSLSARMPFPYSPAMFPWPYLMPPVTSTLAGLPAFVPPVLPGRYLNPGLFTSQPSKNPNGEAFSQYSNARGNNATVTTAATPDKTSSLQSILSNRLPMSSSITSQANPTVNPRGQNPLLLAEFARAFHAQAEQMKTNEAVERRRKSAKPSRVQSSISPPNGLNEMIFSSREQLFKDMPTMANINQFSDVFLRCQDQNNSLKRKATQQIKDNSWQQTAGKKIKHDGIHSDHMSSNSGSPRSDYEQTISPEGLRQPQPTTFQPCRIPCTKCGRTYATTGALAKHAKTHEDPDVETKFNCKICQKECSSLGALRMHIRTHTLPCECHICGKAFSRTWLLQGHIRTHTGEKPYQCTVCSRAFADRSNLRAHMQTHETIKRYACTSCNKTFSRISLLKRHQVNCTGTKALPQ